MSVPARLGELATDPAILSEHLLKVAEDARASGQTLTAEHLIDAVYMMFDFERPLPPTSS